MTTDKYDFKNAPEGTTHFNPETAIAAKCWVKIENGVVYFRYSTNNSWYYWFMADDKNKQHYMENFVEVKPKDKEGWIPPVGAICEAWYSSRRDWCEAEVLKVDSDEHGTLIAARELDTDYLFWSHDFRPLKTKEEIEREEAIAEMRDDILNHEYTEASLEEYLIDLGWKKK